ncbi:MAG: hypothetical protein KKB50_04830 [Planctomycetes bacterium]|nr:hypothetical protein [Planctomycetota bacterium]
MYHFAQRSRHATCVGSALLTMALLGGCALESVLQDILPSAPSFQIVGADNDRMFAVQRIDSGEGLPFVPVTAATPRHLRGVDLDTLDSEVLVNNIPAFADDIAASTDWAAWIDRTQVSVIIADMTNERFWTYLPGLDGSASTFTLGGLHGDRLVLHRGYGEGTGPGGQLYEFIVMDLDTEAETRIAGSWLYATYALEGDYLALMTDAPTTATPLGLELTTSIDLVNLASGERETIAPNLRVAGDGSALFMNANRVIWQEFKAGGFQSQVNAYDVATGQTTTLANNFAPADGERWVRDVGDAGLLVETRRGYALTGEVVSFSLRSYTGETTEIVEFPNTLTYPHTYAPLPRFVGEQAVWTDPYVGEFVLYDPDTASTRRYDPTEE